MSTRYRQTNRAGRLCFASPSMFPAAAFPATRDFWAAALLAKAQVVPGSVESTALTEPASMSWVDPRRRSGHRRSHLDIGTDDVKAEVARVTGLGATRVAEGRTWVVMQDPSGLLFDVVPHESPWFEERARTVSQAPVPLSDP